jgi:hypothetical protein
MRLLIIVAASIEFRLIINLIVCDLVADGILLFVESIPN